MKIRKHKGINQSNGKLKKGFKYSGKKLKSGLPQIIKIKKLKTKTKTKKNIKGGAIIGQGSFGCVVSPNLKCNPNDSRTNISKLIINKSDYDEEIKALNIIKPVDPTMKYILFPIDTCKLNRNLKDKFISCISCNNKDLQQCDLNVKDQFDENNNPAKINYNIIMKYGGNDLYHLNKTQTELFIKNFEYYFKYLLSGIKHFHSNNILHRDIKPDNIVINNKGEIRFIDIGFIHQLSKNDFNTFDDILDLLSARTIYYRPLNLDMIEFYIYGKYYNKPKISFQKFKQKWQTTDREDKYDETIKSILKNMFERKNYNTISKKLNSKLEKIYNNFSEKFIKNHMKSEILKWDIYSLRVTFFEMYKKLNMSNIKLKNLVKPLI